MEKVKEYYNKFQYPLIKQYTNRQKRNHTKLLKKILSFGNLSLKDIKNKKILDAGCGTGDKSVFFALNKAKVTAIDLTSNQLKEAKLLALKNNVFGDIIFKQKDIVNNTLEDLDKFDIILCTGVLHHTENAYKGFYNLTKLLKPNGVIIIALYHRYARWRYRFIRFLLHLFVSRKPEILEKWFKTSYLAKPLKKAPTNSVFDRYLVPYESYHTLKEVRRWFRKNKIIILNHSDNVKGFEPFKIFERKTLFFVGGKLIK